MKFCLKMGNKSPKQEIAVYESTLCTRYITGVTDDTKLYDTFMQFNYQKNDKGVLIFKCKPLYLTYDDLHTGTFRINRTSTLLDDGVILCLLSCFILIDYLYSDCFCRPT